ncbi:MAG: transcription elongation factor GreA [Gammaproteobacteria bacterium]|jgi:transcription elongation factor GreA|nr:transcription elongation factor GreA [Gammaproteobacteria bacterium]
MNRVPITAGGVRKLRAQLHQLKTVERPRIIQEIAAARDHGDISENAEFHAAKEQQGFIEGRIRDLEGQLGCAQVIDPTTLDAGGKVVFGATLGLLDCDGGSKVTYQIVGDLEADITECKISISSPIARALIGRKEGDIVDVDVPDGVRSYEILTVRYV